ncbi:MAG: MATE family efflux transporter [Proteobacteria bacterium]|nr:MATE family efflux transporter [Pseudomonadota bacterium]
MLKRKSERRDDSSFRVNASKIALFSSISYVVDYSFQLVDIFWVAKIGEGAPTAIAIISSVFFLVLALNEIVGVSTVPLFSQAVGSGNKDNAGLVMMQSILAKVVLGCLIALLFVGFLIFIAPLYPLSPEVFDFLYSYGWIIWISLVVVPVYSTMMTALRNVGEGSKAALISCLAFSVNIILNPLFIFGVGEFNGMGIAGAAWATVLAQLLAMVAAIYYLRRNCMGINIFSSRFLVWRPEIYSKLVLIGLPVGGIMILFDLEQAGIAALVASFEDAVSDGFGIGTRVFGLLFMLNFGIAVGISVTVGQHVGRGEFNIVRRHLPSFVMMSTLAVAAIATVVFIFSYDIISLFTTNPISVTTGGEYLRYMSVAICLLCILYSLNAAFEGTGRNLPILIVSVFMYLGVELPLIYFFAQLPGFELSDIWTSVFVATLIGVVVTSWIFHLGWWIPRGGLSREPP